MGSLTEEEDQFFDAREDIISISDSGSDCPDNADSDSAENSGAVLGSSGFDGRFSSSQSSTSRWSSDTRELSDRTLDDNFACRIKNLDDGTEFVIDESGQDGMSGTLREVGSNCFLTVDEFERRLGLSPLVQKAMRRDVKEVSNFRTTIRKQGKGGWLRRLSAVACIVDNQVESANMISNDSFRTAEARIQMVRVRSYKKQCKEFSGLYMGQDIQAHEGSILTMKFSSDGQYLASAGEDGVVRIWQVVESERSGGFANHDIDPSNVYFRINELHELVPVHAEKDRKDKFKSVRKTSDSICVLFPRKVFRILEKPIHEFYGHCDEVLDLSWSKDKCILSSSVDKTVRLWRVGCDECLKVFHHNNYVTCVQFNPVNDDYFISGSIDGKVRIWAIPGRQVVGWTDITEIVTAVCYCPDGKGAVVGSMNGNCRFYDASDNSLQLYAQTCLQSKKKSPLKRITGFQFSPGDPNKLMITSADSQVRILHGVDVVCKFRGICNTGSQISASFTSDGKHIVSASEDSNVYVWNYVSQDGPVPQPKNYWCCERFSSNNASVAIPWSGMTSENSIFSNLSETSPSPTLSSNFWGCYEYNGLQRCQLGESSQCELSFSSSGHFPQGHSFFSESLHKGRATWPEEKLPPSSSLVASFAICKSQYKLLKTSWVGALGSPHTWGLVIVTGGWDGRIRSFQNYGLPVRI